MDEIKRKVVLEVDHMGVAYETRTGDVQAVRDVSFTVHEGETVGLVGESGCGKSTIAFGLINYLGANGKITDGEVRLRGSNLLGASEKELKKLRGNSISMVYQDPMQALNPSIRLGEQLIEVLTSHSKISQNQARKQVLAMLKKVNMPDPESVMDRYTHQISGGQQQRIVIAMAMLNNPALLIMDEPTTALDVTVEAAVLDLLEELKQEYRTANIFITHNLGVVARVCDTLCVMYAGELVEKGSVADIFKHPSHPYTIGLLSCVPRLGESKAESILRPIKGRVPPPVKRPDNACIFAPRCEFATKECLAGRPDMVNVGNSHFSRCIYADKMDGKRKRDAKKTKQNFPRQPENSSTNKESMLHCDDLRVYYTQESKSIRSLFGLGTNKYVKAVDGVSVTLAKGKTLGIVGESGCGKSTLVKGLIGLEEITEGDVQFLGIDVTDPVAHRETNLIREMQMVFQNPDSTLNPSYSIGSQIARPIKKFKVVPRGEVKKEVCRLLKAVRLSASYYDRLPRQLSGGEKQRVGIARALASRPDLIICDEPVSALDVSVQAAVVNLLLEIQSSLDATMIFIAHDLSVVRFFSDEIAVMYLGQIVEIGPADSIYLPPYHPYTEALLSAVPVPDPETVQKDVRLSGNVPSALNPPAGCSFHTRCPRRKIFLEDGGRICKEKEPPWQINDKGHRIACHIPLELLKKADPVFHHEPGLS
ncbi:dipeptide ABC transporter ATP-binding protein [Desulforhopalus singaporensis]|uniref:Peptide/nickel transport system ATP-binding protein n=1 Tax=Desulforhopalus singaporensis TaxID=91360 RepID=A0A1H0VHD3_9BACT|nr:dipeptide ABC transporter ATP-binding protein [Desulforhopalus singaporensis]SDP77754.1 peptide/nickel transport system ATP-binding protein [Desulforhopalus singaporensis]